MPTATPGPLPSDGSPILAGIQLPPGRAIAPEAAPNAPVAWISSQVLPEPEITGLLRTLMAAYGQTGLWPLHAQGRDGLRQPWLDGEFAGFDPRTFTARQVLDGSFRASLYDDDRDLFDEFEPEFRFTDFADPVEGPAADPADVGVDEPGALLLVPVDRPANVPKALGWWGPINYDLAGEPVSAVLRSWEERFGTVPVSLTPDSLTLCVPRHPRRKRFSRQGDQQLRLLAAEHYAFCPDNVDQGLDAEDYVNGLNDWNYWEFWWD
ncbi:DUF4253 domain-containing protein [Gordonia iterans]